MTWAGRKRGKMDEDSDCHYESSLDLLPLKMEASPFCWLLPVPALLRHPHLTAKTSALPVLGSRPPVTWLFTPWQLRLPTSEPVKLVGWPAGHLGAKRSFCTGNVCDALQFYGRKSFSVCVKGCFYSQLNSALPALHSANQSLAGLTAALSFLAVHFCRSFLEHSSNLWLQ